MRFAIALAVVSVCAWWRSEETFQTQAMLVEAMQLGVTAITRSDDAPLVPVSYTHLTLPTIVGV